MVSVFKLLVCWETNKVAMSNVTVKTEGALGEMGLWVSGKISRFLERRAALTWASKYIEEF